MYQIFFMIQKKHWWFITKKMIVLDIIDKYLTKHDNNKVLDIGCGSGLMLNALKKLDKPTAWICQMMLLILAKRSLMAR